MAIKSLDLDAFRGSAATITGTALGDWGMLPDPDHLDGGGYHCGLTDLVRIYKFHYPRDQHVGSSTEDYSARQWRDRVAIDERCAAVDGPDDWGNGGRAAWIRHNNMIVRQLQLGDPELGALRAINFTPDGKVKRRYDSLHPTAGPDGDGVISSTDTVLWHTHYEFWRDTLGTALMQRTLKLLLQIMRAAVRNVPLSVIIQEETVIMGQQLLVRPKDSSRVWKCDGILRFPIPTNRTTDNANNHLPSMLGPLGNGGKVYVWDGTEAEMDYWGVDARNADPAALAAALGPLLNVAVSTETVTQALESARGQAAIVKGANTAESS